MRQKIKVSENHEKLFNSMKNGHNELKFGHKVNFWGPNNPKWAFLEKMIFFKMAAIFIQDFTRPVLFEAQQRK